MSGEGRERLKDEGSREQVVVAGAVAGLVSRFFIAPLDVIKIRLQLQIHSLSDPLSLQGVNGPVYKGTLPTLKTILREEGLTGLWKGNVPAELLYLFYGSCQFTTYHSTNHLLSSLPRRLPPSAESFISGAVAGGIATTTTYPLDLLRTRFAAQGNDKVYTSLRDSIRNIWRSEGPSGFFQGLGAGVGQIVPYMGLFFSTYEALRLPLAEYNLPLGTGDATAGVLASVFAKTGVFPLDLIRKRLQVQGPTRERYVHHNIPVYKGVSQTMKDIIKAEGIRGLYRGLTVSLFKAVPAGAITVWTYERVLNVMREMERQANIMND
ncbi:MAG: mitochondrial thiamine pyrophosphate transporter [Cirrosporium novae-zelandiae]|nr:MAG: mitochondrial thiamine pyrophosphate transporter [Cirrosporium novae-zelandiae]